jgi:hypothetical protein
MKWDLTVAAARAPADDKMALATPTTRLDSGSRFRHGVQTEAKRRCCGGLGSIAGE